jgi:hypothetical protein
MSRTSGLVVTQSLLSCSSARVRTSLSDDDSACNSCSKAVCISGGRRDIVYFVQVRWDTVEAQEYRGYLNGGVDALLRLPLFVVAFYEASFTFASGRQSYIKSNGSRAVLSVALRNNAQEKNRALCCSP